MGGWCEGIDRGVCGGRRLCRGGVSPRMEGGEMERYMMCEATAASEVWKGGKVEAVRREGDISRMARRPHQ